MLNDRFAPYIQSQLPDVNIEFIVGNNDLDFYKFMNENGELPDIITCHRFSLHDAADLKDQLLDLSTTEEAGAIYESYIDNFTNSDGTVNWLPICGTVDSLVANRALFEEYDIPLPTDYDSMVSACQSFEEKGIRGFVADFAYDYTCMEVFQGLSIPEITSMEGRMWRSDYENPSEDSVGLDQDVWPGAFESMEQFIKDVNILPTDLEKDTKRQKKAMQVLEVMLSEEGQNHFANGEDVVSKMIEGEYDAKQAYEAFDAQLKQPKEDTAKTVLSINRSYSRIFHKKGGNESLAKTAGEFKSGEEAYLLNREVTDGTQVWYQNIDNGKTPDDYPVLDNTHGTVYRLSDGTYSNYDTEPEKETYEIYTFEDFKKIPEIVKKNNRADFKLMNTIFGNGETLTELIGSAELPYNGTFDGQGYYVYRFDMKPTDGDAALFDTIGSMGTVKNLGIFFQTVEGEKAAGIALTNYGLIDECISGSNLSGSFVDKLSGETLPLSETTTFVKGKSMAGGVVVENKGVIRNTANYAEATAASSDGIAGGIAVINSGTIENCLSMGKLKTGENGIAGGITGTLTGNGIIHIAYCASASIEAKTVGAVCGQNETAVARSGEGAISDTFYLNTLFGGEEQGTAKAKEEMRSDAFKDELNTLTEGKEGLCRWTRSDSKNSAYPKILSSLVVETELINASKGLTVKGLMHKDTKLQLTELDKKNEIYKAFQKYVENSDRQILYCGEPALVYEDGQPAAYEETLKLKLDLSKYRGKDYKVLVYRNDKVEELAINQQMIASKEVEELAPFAVLAKKSILSQVVKTGDTSNLLLWLGIFILAGSASAGILYWRRKKASK